MLKSLISTGLDMHGTDLVRNMPVMILIYQQVAQRYELALARVSPVPSVYVRVFLLGRYVVYVTDTKTWKFSEIRFVAPLITERNR